jgi:hypothetical protein
VNDTSVSFEINDVREAPGLNVMSGSSEISDTWDAPAAARVATPVMVERPKSARQALRCLLIKMFAFIDERDVSVETFHLKKYIYPFQICVNHTEAVHVHQAIRNVNQLNTTSARFCGEDRGATNKLSAVCAWVLLDELVDVPVFHPLGDHRKPAFTYRYSKQW